MDELLAQFLVEGRELVADAHAGLGRLAIDPADPAALDSLFRAIHTLKGSVAIFDMKAAERALHASEDVLAAARRGDETLTGAGVEALVAIVDQVDRWIDDLEQGVGPGDADAVTADLVAGLRQEEVEAATTAAVPNWLSDLKRREATAVAGASGTLTAFRYQPDADCFFRGDDPLALVAGVPGLVTLTVLPREAWPDLAEWDPFRCMVELDGLSTAAVEEVRAAFRLVPDQVEVSALDAGRAAPVPPAAVPADTARTIRVEGSRLDRLTEELGELVAAANGLSALATGAEKHDPELAAAIRLTQSGLDRALARLRRSASSLRLVTLGPALRRLPRLVRQIADELGKPVRFTMRGEGLEVDKDLADALFEPLLHLLRNAVDHGIEPPADRARSGKPAAGRIHLAAVRRGGEVAVTLSDDGRGIDADRIRRAAVERGAVDPAAAARLSDADAQRLIFVPGFSTAEAVTGISGRGVGADSVKAMVDRLGGRLELDSRAGEGTRFTLLFPAHALTTKLLAVRVGAERYGVSFDQIREVVRVGRDRLVEVGSGRACVLRDRTLPVLSLAALLGGSEESDTPDLRLLVTDTGEGPVALIVDAVEQAMEAQVRAREGLLVGMTGMAGTTLLPDGNVLIVLDLPELIG